MKFGFKMMAVLGALSVGPSAEAAVMTQWNFNSDPADAATGTGVTTPAVGIGGATLLGVTGSFSSGDASGGSSDPSSGDDSGWQTTGYAAQSVGNKTRGTQYLVSTLGFENITVSYDLRHSNTSSRYEQVQYTLDGSIWNDVAQFDGNAGDTWFNGRSVDFSAIAGVADNPLFGVRIVAAFAPGGTGYLASDATKTYGAAGTWRFDMVTVSGSEIAAVPVPGAVWLFGSALIGLLGGARRKA
ncbi:MULTISPECIES: PEP-CTERM sorting domain-containing protein [Methylomonas]|nr:PEP-CTERM sorting domain-containing protein [Methylomonas koyamae]